MSLHPTLAGHAAARINAQPHWRQLVAYDIMSPVWRALRLLHTSCCDSVPVAVITSDNSLIDTA